MQFPTTTQWTVAKKVLRYLKGTIDHNLFFSKSSLNLHAFCDLDWAGVMIVGLPLGLASCLVLASSLGVQRNNPWWLGLVLRPSITPWPIPLLIYIGSVCSLTIFTFLLPLLLSYGATMLVRQCSHIKSGLSCTRETY